MSTTPIRSEAHDLDEAQIARDAAEQARYLQAADVHRADQAQAQGRHRAEAQARFDEALPRADWPRLP